MNKDKARQLFKGILIVCLISTCTSTYAASGSLWGDIDKPVSKEELTAPAVVTPPPVVPEVVTKKNICEVLIAQPNLNMADLNNPTLVAQMRNTIQVMAPEYKILVGSNQALQKLYQEYRAKYMQVYCTKN